MEVPVAYLLQYLSTVVGGVILAWYYFNWLRSQPLRVAAESDTWRYFVICTLASISLAAGLLLAKLLGETGLREFVYTMGVSAVSVFSFLIVVAAVLCYRRKLAGANNL